VKVQEINSDSQFILYDADAFPDITREMFDPEVLASKNKIIEELRGRGIAWVISHEDTQYVLRHYRRGGLIEKLLRDKYIWSGLDNSRAWMEWRLLKMMAEMNLPVPEPAAARVVKYGLFYRADLITKRILHTRSLAESLVEDSLSDEFWISIGQTIRKFHRAGVNHSDMNAHNILLADDHQIHLIDFDRCGIESPGPWLEANMSRLLRSLRKLAMEEVSFSFHEKDWLTLMAGYNR